MTAPDLRPSLVADMKKNGVDVTMWNPEIYNRFKHEMYKPGTSIVYLREEHGNTKLGIQRQGVYVKILGYASHVLYPKGFKDHENCAKPTVFVTPEKDDGDVYGSAKRFIREHFDIEPESNMTYNWPYGFWPDLNIKEMVEYPIPFAYAAMPVSIELHSEQFDPMQELTSRVDGSQWVWIKRPPRK